MEQITDILKAGLSKLPKNTTNSKESSSPVLTDVPVSDYGLYDQTCKKCKGRGWVSQRNQVGDTERDYTKLVPCDCYVQRSNQYRTSAEYLQRCGVVPAKDGPKTFDNFKRLPGTDDAFKTLKALAEGTSDYLFALIHGSTGNGKTHLAQAFVRASNARGIDSRYFEVADLIAEWKSAIKTNNVETRFDEIKGIPALVLDDFKQGYIREWGADLFERLISFRYANYKVTVLITNCDLPEIPERILSRFADKSMGRVVVNHGSDYRRRA